MKRSDLRFAIVVSKFNTEVTTGLLNGALKYFRSKEIADSQIETLWIPGAFEAPLVAKKLAESQKYNGIVCLGAVIKGDTAHFEFISLGATVGIMQSMLQTNTPITFGILTTYTDEQASHRSLDDSHNKGIEASAACFETVEILSKI